MTDYDLNTEERAIVADQERRERRAREFLETLADAAFVLVVLAAFVVMAWWLL